MTGLLLNPTVAVLFYGGVLGVVCAMAALAGVKPLGLIAAWLGADWIGFNAVFALLHAHQTPWLSPSLSALICVGLASVAIRHHSNVAWWMVRLFVLSFAFTVGSFWTHSQGTISYYIVLNVIFMGRMIILGGASYAALADRYRRGDLILAHRSVSVASHRPFRPF